MEVTLEVEGLKPNHKKFVVAKLIRGSLQYYDSYHTIEKAQMVVDKIENGVIIEK